MEDEPEREELGGKEVSSRYKTTAQAAVQFIGKGINSIRSVEELFGDDTEHKGTLPLPEAELIGRISIGNLLFAQGIELMFKLIFIAEKLEDKGFRQHDLTARFEVIRKLSPVKDNLEIWMPKMHTNKVEKAKELVVRAEEAFMVSRYLGFRDANLNSVNALDAAGLLLSLVFSYQGLEQVEAARLIGYDIEDENGKPWNPSFTKIRS